MERPFGKWLVIGWALIVALLIINAGVTFRNTRQLHNDAYWVAHTQEVIRALDVLLSTVKDAETGERGYLITDDEGYLVPYRNALVVVGERLEHVQELTEDNPGQQTRIPQLRKAVQEKLDELARTITLRRNFPTAHLATELVMPEAPVFSKLVWSGVNNPVQAVQKETAFEAAQKEVMTHLGKNRMDAIRAYVAQMQADERSLLEERERANAQAYHTAVLSAVITSLLALAAVVGFVVVLGRHLRARAKATAVIHEQREQLRTTLASIGDAVVVTDREGHVRFLNPVAESLTGWRQTEAAGKPLDEVFNIVNEATHKTVENPVVKVLREGVVVGLANHTELIARDGNRRPIDDSAAPIKDGKDSVSGVVLVFRDVAERRRAEKATRFLADASKSLAGLVDYNSTMQKVARLAVPFFADWCSVDMLAPDGSLRRLAVAHVNPAKVELAAELGRRYPPDPNAPQGAWHIVRTGQSEMISDITDSLLEEMVKDRELLDILKELGLKSYMAVPIQTRGKPLGVITFIAAESGRKYDATDLSVAEDLAHRAGVAIDNAHLYSELKEADRRKDEFLAMLAHELRNPLAPIRNAVQIMKTPGANSGVLERVREMLERQVQHMTRMVDDLLDVSRITRGKIELRKEIVELASIVHRTVDTIRPIVEDRSQELTVDLPPQPVLLDADPTRLEQIIANLLTNAAKYTDQKGHIWLTARVEEGSLVLRVKDTGMGLAPDMLWRIFDPFVQSDRVLHRSQGGLGIGLTLVRSLVEMHGGTVQAFSEGPGKGSEFVVHLPVVAVKAPQKEVKTEGDGKAASVATTKRRILVVDDNVDAAESLAMLLKMQGHEVRVEHDGPAALAAAIVDQPEFVFLDIGMPVMNGYDVAQRLRQRPELEDLVLVAMTGWGQEDDRRRSEEAGFDYHLVKPADMEVIQQLLAQPTRRVQA